ncbi:MAG: translation initiation factor IF-2 [Gemmatales bacterium]|nr:translation initiation factor IF-2 [Gemmatales bacterium]MDW8223881.1 translation initiation factor IF-2 [Gemmatales bacterium]
MSTATEQRNERRKLPRGRAKIRAHQLAHELGITWRDLQELARREGIEIHNQLCGLTEEEASRLRAAYQRAQAGQVAAEGQVASASDEVVGREELPKEVSSTVSQTATGLVEPQPIAPRTEAVAQKAAVDEGRAEKRAPSEAEATPSGLARAPGDRSSTVESVPGSGDGQGAVVSRSAPAQPASSIASPVEKKAVSAAAPTAPATTAIPPAKETVSVPARPKETPATSTTAPLAGPKPVKHMVNLDQLRRRQQEIRQQQTQQQTGAVPSGPAAAPARPSGTPGSTESGTTTPASPAASGSSPGSPTSPSPPPVKGTTTGPVPFIQKPKPAGSATPSTSPKTPTTPPVAFVVRKTPNQPPKSKPKDQPGKEVKEQKPLATLEEALKKKEQQKPEAPAVGTVLLRPPKKDKPDAQPIDIKEAIRDVKLVSDDEEELRPSGKRRPGVVPGREERRQRRREEARLRTTKTAADTLVEQEPEAEIAPPVARRVRAEVKPAAPRPSTQPRKGKVPIEPPITVRSLSEALGVSAHELLSKLVQRGRMLNINATLPEELAEELALEFNLELQIKKPTDPEEEILKQLQAPDRPEDLVPRPPVVTVMGHVDHGKTSLLDRIRESDVVSTEAGGITQHLRAWQVEHGGRPITFLDTPGHEAFTAMRARGAHVTDIVVLVVAADDGVMPQTEEALSHARAANVPIIVAINKVDLPNANVTRTRHQLYNLGLIPDTMGGDTPFVETVAAKDRARGIDELLDMISVVAELRELKANPKKPASGTCLEAKVTEGQGVVATLLVQNGTLRVGHCIVCGSSYGRVRAMLDSNGRSISEAGPSTPVAVTGLDQVPEAGEKFFAVPDLATAREIVERRRERLRFAEPVRLSTFRLEDLSKGKVQELKIVLKADVRGSLEAIRKELDKLQHQEIRLNVIHAGVGAITEGDVQLALASPEDTLIVGFNVVPDHRAQSLAEQRGVPIRLYNIIYQLTDDLKAALEGRLKPREEVVALGRAVVREVFKISKVGTVAGCFVVQGTVERGAQVRVIREGRVVYPPPERTATIESLKRFKEDVREVREGFECGIKISNFDDVKVDDVLEVFRVVQVQRTLDETPARAPSV